MCLCVCVHVAARACVRWRVGLAWPCASREGPETSFFFLLYFYFVYFWLCWVFVAAHGLFSSSDKRGYSSL